MDKSFEFIITDAKRKHPLRWSIEASDIDEAFEYALIAADVNRYFNVTEVRCVEIDGKSVDMSFLLDKPKI